MWESEAGELPDQHVIIDTGWALSGEQQCHIPLEWSCIPQVKCYNLYLPWQMPCHPGPSISLQVVFITVL